MAGLASRHPKAAQAVSSMLLWLLCLVLPFCLTVLASRFVWEKREDRIRSEFTTLAIENEKAVLYRLASYEHALLGAEGFFRGSSSVSREEWRLYTQALNLPANFPGITALAYAAQVKPEEMDQFLADMKADGTPDFTIRPEMDGDLLFPVIFAEPMETNWPVIGVNLAFETHRRNAAILARDTGQPVISAPIQLLQDVTRSAGFVLLHPVYRNGMSLETIRERRAAFRGWICASFIGANLLDDLTQSQSATLHLMVYDGMEENPDKLVYSSDNTPDGATGTFTISKRLHVMQRVWTLVWTSTPAFEASKKTREPFLVLISGLILTAGISTFVRSSIRRAATVERLVEEKTKEFAASEERLKLLIRHTPAAVAMFDQEMRYIMTSERWLLDYGLDGQNILGKSHYEIFPEILQHPEWPDHHRRVQNGESLFRAEDCWERSDGRIEWVKWALHPWIDSDRQIGGIVMFTEVITQRKEAELRSDLLREVAMEAADAPTAIAALNVALVKMCRYLRWPIGHGYWWKAEKAFQDAAQIWHTESVEHAQPETYRPAEAISFALKNRLTGRAIAEAKPTVVVAPPGDDEEAGEMPCLQSGLAVPVFVGRRVVAVLEFFSPNKAVEDKALLGFCELVGLQLSRVIERKEVKAALKESEERYERAVQGSSVGLWEWDIRSGTMFWSARFSKIVGMAAQNVSSDVKAFQQRLHPRDRTRVFAAIVGHLKRRTPFDVEYRLLHANGDYRWIHSRGQATWDESGKALLMAGSADDITERKRTESALEDSNRLNSAILASTTSLVIATDPAGCIALFNNAAEAALGYSAREVVGKPLPPIYDWNEMAGRARELTRKYGERIEPGFEVFTHKARLRGAESLEWTFIRKDGSRFPVHMTTTPLIGANGEIDGFLSMVDDITERLAQQEVLKEREARLSNIIDKAVDGLIVIDERGAIETFNPAAERMFGYGAGDVIGRNVTMLMPERLQASHRDAMQRHRDNSGLRLGEVVHELIGRRSDGSEFPIDLSISNVSLPGRRIFSGIIRDISSRKETEHKLIAYAAELERSNRELDEFAYVASHDLKAPLRVIGNASRWLEEDLAPHMSAEDKMNMEMLRGRVQRMEKLLDDLLEYSRVGRSSDERFAERVNGQTLMSDILLLLSPAPEFTIAVLPGFEAIEINRMPVQQVLFNLIGNAIKHHDRKDGRIEVSVEDGGDIYTFTVRDDGPGIPQRFHEQVFKMFQTLKPRDQVEGSGMGLAFVKKNVGYFGGEIRLVSEEGKGAAFSFTWPKQQKPVGGALQWKAA
jgi:two-component system sensor kinase FixL